MNHDDLKSKFSYNPDTGEFVRLFSTRKWAKGSKAGGVISSGYVSIHIDGKRFLAHRLAWLYMTGQLPDGVIDHIDRNPLNNKWSNLRAATKSENSFNTRQLDKGASYSPARNKWLSRIVLRGKTVYLGWFPTKEGALSAYREFSELAHGEFCCTRAG